MTAPTGLGGLPVSPVLGSPLRHSGSRPSGLALSGNRHQKRGFGSKYASVEVPSPQPRTHGAQKIGKMLCLFFGEPFYFQMICFL